MKLQAGREKDLSDLFMTRDMAIDPKDIHDMFRSIRKPSLDEKLRIVLKRLDDEKTFNDAMARRGYGRRGKLDRAKFKAKVETVVNPILLEGEKR